MTDTQDLCQSTDTCAVVTQELFLVVVVVVVFQTGFLCIALASWNSLCRPGWPPTQKSAYLCLPSAGIKGVRHHTQLRYLLNQNIVAENNCPLQPKG
jgi:hypothetical protein